MKGNLVNAAAGQEEVGPADDLVVVINTEAYAAVADWVARPEAPEIVHRSAIVKEGVVAAIAAVNAGGARDVPGGIDEIPDTVQAS